jgi:DUF971 family protein
MIKPTKIHLHKQSKTLEIGFSDNASQLYQLPAELLRTHSPSAEVRGHGVGQEVLVYGKSNVGINSIKPAGNYGLHVYFDDGHDTGIFTWTYLKELSATQEALWESYLEKLKTAGKNRDPHVAVLHFP